MFVKKILSTKNQFQKLSKNVIFENVGYDRKGTTLVMNKNDLIPIVRTTTKYDRPFGKFNKAHINIIKEIQKYFPKLQFNNGLIEIYGDKYKKMRYHSDQALDLVNDSYICLFSCYDGNFGSRILRTKNKIDDTIEDFVLDNNSIILFSTETNKLFLHKIILKEFCNPKWLGFTLRLSKTFVKFINEKTYFTNGKELNLANNDEKKQFYKYRRQENKTIDFVYPNINFTISKNDLLKPMVSGNLHHLN